MDKLLCVCAQLVSLYNACMEQSNAIETSRESSQNTALRARGAKDLGARQECSVDQYI